MSDIPIQAFIFPAIALGAAVYVYATRRKRLSSMDAQYSNYRAGQLAQRLGMTLVEGDPEFNLWITQANKEVDRGPSDRRPVHVQIRMGGNRGGTVVELLYLSRVEQETGFTEVTRKRWFDCRMVAYPRQPFPPFEVVSRTTPLGPIAATQPLPAQSTGNPSVDAMYAVCTREPRLAQLLGSLLPGFAMFANAGVHLVGDGKTVAFLMGQEKPPLLASSLYFAEAMADQLTNLARAVGG